MPDVEPIEGMKGIQNTAPTGQFQYGESPVASITTEC